MADTWFVKTQAGEDGPLSGRQLRQLATEGRLSTNTHVRKGPAGQWIPATEVKGLFDPIPPPITSAIAVPQNSNTIRHGQLAAKQQLTILVGVVAICFVLIVLVTFWVATRRPLPPTRLPPMQVATGSNSANDAELLRIRQENADLKTRLAQLEVMVKQSDQPAISPTRILKFESPESVVRAYISASVWQDRVPCVAQPDTVRSAMQRAYERVTLAGPVVTQLKPDVWGKGTFLPSKLQPDGKILVPVDMTGLDEDTLWEYIVVSTPEGYKVDWLASQEHKLARDREKEIDKWKIKDAKIEVQVLQVKQSGSYTRMSIKVTNKSGAFISTWKVGVSVFDRSENFLAGDFGIDSNLRPGDSCYYERISFNNVDATAISSWRLRLESLTLENEAGKKLIDAENYFELSEIK